MKKNKNLSALFELVIKKTNCTLFVFVFLIFVVGCEEDKIGQPPTSSEVPGMVSNVKVENVHGGAIITYDLPPTEDLLFVKAVYERNGEEINTSASFASNRIEIEGFGDTLKHEVELYSVSRSRVSSQPVITTIQPLTSPVNLILQNLMVQRSFGGVRLDWENQTKTDIAIYISSEDEEGGDMVEREVIYTNSPESHYSVRGLEAVEQMFSFVIRDRWDNYSDTLMQKLTPIHEEQVPPGDIKKLERQIAGDRDGNIAAAYWSRLFDDKLSGWGRTFFMNTDGPMPYYLTFDLGSLVHLSRFKIYDNPRFYYDTHFPRFMSMWGTAEMPLSYMGEDYWRPESEDEGFHLDWIKLGDFENIKPSGPGPDVTDEDIAHASDGHEHEFNPGHPPVRYIRIAGHENWNLSTRILIVELRFWGSIMNN